MRILTHIIRPFRVIFLVLLFSGCSEEGEFQPSLSEEGGDNIALPALLLNARSLQTSRVQALLKIDHGTPQKMLIKNGRASLDLSNLTAGKHDFFLNFKYETDNAELVSVATAKKTVELRLNQENSLGFLPSDYRFPDEDGDGVSNLRELDYGSDIDDPNDPDFLPEMMKVAAGSFQMGSPANEAGGKDDERLHTVNVPAFLMGKNEVTVHEFRRFVEATDYITDAERDAGGMVGCDILNNERAFFTASAGISWRNPGFRQNEQYPVVCISWFDATAYAEWLSSVTGHSYTLPTEAQWEYAARAGSSSAYFFGDDGQDLCRWANIADRDLRSDNPVLSTVDCSDGYITAAPIGEYEPNPLGLLDVIGNVYEWTCSRYEHDYNGSESLCAEVLDADSQWVLRGGGWSSDASASRIAGRDPQLPFSRYSDSGFRLVRTQ